MCKRPCFLLAFILIAACSRRDDPPVGPNPTPGTAAPPEKKNVTRIVLDREAMSAMGSDVEKVEKVLAANSVKTSREKADDHAVVLLLDTMPDADTLMALKIHDVGKTGQPVYLRDLARIEIYVK